MQNDTAFEAYLSGAVIPDAPTPILNQVINVLYPPIYNEPKKYGYNDTISRLSTLLADVLLNCNVQAVLEAFGVDKSHAYLFQEGPGLHGEETPYMFYDDGPEADAYGFGQVNATVAETLQNWVVTFGATGTPNGQGNVNSPAYGGNHILALLSNKGIGLPVPDPAAKQRCDFWNRALYY